MFNLCLPEIAGILQLWKVTKNTTFKDFPCGKTIRSAKLRYRCHVGRSTKPQYEDEIPITVSFKRVSRKFTVIPI